MPKVRYFLPFFFLLFKPSGPTYLDVRLLTDLKPGSVIVSVASGKYRLTADSKLLADSISSSIIEFKPSGDSVTAKSLERVLGTYKSVVLTAISAGSGLKLKCVNPTLATRIYDDDIRIGSSNNQLILINHLDIEKYVAGVVEAESGTYAEEEFYKAQAILCRTYALANSTKHAPEGFNVCDQVHCQVFRGRTKDPHVFFASHATKDLVAVDNDLKLISTTFSSNCGGQTVNSEDVWGKPNACLKSVRDTFCIHMPHARWERHVSVEDWKNYLQLKHQYPVNDSVSFSNSMNRPQNDRLIYMSDKGLRIPLKTIRADFQLKSTFFSVEQRNDSVIFKGKGYGHGVGLCQEGAMRMARLGYSYRSILNFYYRNITLIERDKIEFFREGEDQ
jgi:stage II sporulation protein D